MNIIKIAILAVIAIATIGVTIFFAIRESEKKKQNRTVFFGVVALIFGVIILLFAFPSYVFISWNKILVELAILLLLIGRNVSSMLPSKLTNFYEVLKAFIFGVLAILGVILITGTLTEPIQGKYITVQEESNVTIKITPTVDPIHHDPTIGYSIDEDGNTTYFYYYKHKDIMYRDDISEKDCEIYYLTSDEDSYIVKDTSTKSYTYSERKDSTPITDVSEKYSLFINSNQMIMINDTK